MQLLSGPVRAMPLAEALITPGGIGSEPTDESGSPLPPGVSLDPRDPYGSSSGGGDSYGGGGGDGGGGLDTWVIIVIIAGVVAVLAAVIGVYVYRRQNQARQHQPKDQLGYYPSGPAYGPQYVVAQPSFGPGGPGSAHPGVYGAAPWPYPPTPGTPTPSNEALNTKLQAVPGSPGVASYRTHSSGGGRTRVEALAARWHAPYTDTDVTFTDDCALPQYSYVSSGDEDVTRNTQASRASRASALSQRSRQSTRSGTYTTAGRGDPGSPVGPPPEGASVPELMDRLARQLDGMHAVGKPIKERFLPLGQAQRRMGGAAHCGHAYPTCTANATGMCSLVDAYTIDIAGTPTAHAPVKGPLFLQP